MTISYPSQHHQQTFSQQPIELEHHTLDSTHLNVEQQDKPRFISLYEMFANVPPELALALAQIDDNE